MSTLDPESLSLLRRAADQPDPVYLVGGALRDALLGRPLSDIDLASSTAKKTALRLAKSLNGTLVTLDEESALYRVVLDGARQIDVAGLQGPDIASDLSLRDFTVNAMALELTRDFPKELPLERLRDPRHGRRDLARKLIRAESDAPLKEDPLRLLRAFRIAAQLGFSIEPRTLKLIGRSRQLVRRSAGERVQNELLTLLALPGASRWLKLMDECELLTALFEELEPSRRCAEVYYGEGGVLKHTLDTAARLEFLLDSPRAAFGGLSRPIEEHLKTDGRRAVLMLAALLHDIAKPSTAKQIGGRLRFFGHDALGAKMASDILKRLKFSGANIALVSAVIANHLRPGNLATGGELTDKAAYRFFRDLGPHAMDLLLVCWADHASYLSEAELKKVLAKPPSLRSEAAKKTARHLNVVLDLMRRMVKSSQEPPTAALLNGRDVMKLLKLKPGPAVGEWLEKVKEAQAVGKLKTRQEAIRFLEKGAK